MALINNHIHIQSQMKSLLILLALVVLASCNTEAGVRQCIRNLTNEATANSICKLENNTSCFNAYYSMTLCLLNNECQKADPVAQMPYNCWHCWAQLQVESDEIKQFQKKIQSCAWQWHLEIGFILAAAIALLLQ